MLLCCPKLIICLTTAPFAEEDPNADSPQDGSPARRFHPHPEPPKRRKKHCYDAARPRLYTEFVDLEVQLYYEAVVDCLTRVLKNID